MQLMAPNNEQITRLSPDGRQVPTQAWAMFHQQMAQQLNAALTRIAALETALAAETVRATAAEAAGRGQPRVDGSGNQVFDFAPGTYIARNASTGAVSVVVNSVVKVTWSP